MKSALLLLLSVLAGASTVQAREIGEFRVGSWYGSAHTNEKGEFNHCSAYTHMRDGTMVSFAVGSNFTWSMAFNHRKWKLREGDPVPVMIGVDDMEPAQLDARAYMHNGIEIGFGEQADLFKRFMTARRVKVLGAPKPIDFKLTGVDRLLPLLLACAHSKGQRSSPLVAEDPAANIPGYTAYQMRSDQALVAEATTLAANFLSVAGVTGYRLLGPAEQPELKGDARWVTPEGIGLLQVYPDVTGDKQKLLGNLLVGDDARSCKGVFVSGTLPEEEKDSNRVFTACDSGKSKLTSYYFTMPRMKGGVYLVATISYEEPALEARAKDADAAVRKAAFAIVGQ